MNNAGLLGMQIINEISAGFIIKRRVLSEIIEIKDQIRIIIFIQPGIIYPIFTPEIPDPRQSRNPCTG
jgi:hypothetical protein